MDKVILLSLLAMLFCGSFALGYGVRMLVDAKKNVVLKGLLDSLRFQVRYMHEYREPETESVEWYRKRLKSALKERDHLERFYNAKDWSI